jgi:hypothetical protein
VNGYDFAIGVLADVVAGLVCVRVYLWRLRQREALRAHRRAVRDDEGMSV